MYSIKTDSTQLKTSLDNNVNVTKIEDGLYSMNVQTFTNILSNDGYCTSGTKIEDSTSFVVHGHFLRQDDIF